VAIPAIIAAVTPMAWVSRLLLMEYSSKYMDIVRISSVGVPLLFRYIMMSQPHVLVASSDRIVSDKPFCARGNIAIAIPARMPRIADAIANIIQKFIFYSGQRCFNLRFGWRGCCQGQEP